MANTFLLAKGVEIGKSLAEPDFAETALEIMHAAKARSCEIVLPQDVVVAREVRSRRAVASVVTAIETPKDEMILDVGPKTVAHYTDVLSRCETLLWNGPLGAFEIAPFGEGTFALARAAAQAHQSRQAGLGCRRRRHRRSPQRGWRNRRLHLRILGRRRLPRMARRPRAARRGRTAALIDRRGHPRAPRTGARGRCLLKLTSTSASASRAS